MAELENLAAEEVLEEEIQEVEAAEELAEAAEEAVEEEEAPVAIEDLPDEAFDFDDELPVIETPPEIHRVEDPATASDFELKHWPRLEVIKMEEPPRWVYKVQIGDAEHVHPQDEEHFFDKMVCYAGNNIEDIIPMSVGSRHKKVIVCNLAEGDEAFVQVVCNKHGIWESNRVPLINELYVPYVEPLDFGN